MDSLHSRVEQLTKTRAKDWQLDGHSVRVDLPRRGRAQKVRFEQAGDRYLFRSVVLPSAIVTASNDRWRKLAYRAWRRNSAKEIVTFSFDRHDRLIGLIEVPAATLDDDELVLYIETLAKECDRFEYALTGEDRE